MAQTWGNLTVVHERLGDQDLANLARVELQKILDGPPVEMVAGREIRWVDSNRFKGPAPRERQPSVNSSRANPVPSRLDRTARENQESKIGRLFKSFF